MRHPSRGIFGIAWIVFCVSAASCSCGDRGTNGHLDGVSDPAGDGSTVCIDRDGDGYGRNCDRGGDCNDGDPAHWNDCSDCAMTHAEGCTCEDGESYSCYEGPSGTDGQGPCRRGTRRCRDGQLGSCEGQVLPEPVETCDDGIDNNCNGEVDEAGFCGECVPPCYTDGAVIPSPSDPGSSGLVPNPDGPGVILGSSSGEGGFAWIANSSEGTVSKLDIVTGAEVGRFRVGLAGTGDDSPSRTAVDDYQSAYVACRAFDLQGSVTKIAGFERYCNDRNGNGVIDTSRGSAPLGLGEDECVLWTVPIGDTNAIPRALIIDFGTIDLRSGFPWVGCYNERRFYKLDPGDGAELDRVDIDVTPYGAAIDSEGWVWVSGRGDNAIQRFHYIGGAVEPSIPVPGSSCNGSDPYGITIDRNDRPWVGVWDTGGACRYDADGGTWLYVNTGGRGRGVAVDADNTIWVTNDGEGTLYRFSAEDGSSLASFPIPGSTPIGVGADRLGKIWAISYDSDDAARFDPSTSAFERFPVGQNPYTYSDFLGFQRWLQMPNGIWIMMLERCNDRAGDEWGVITWETDTPGDSHIRIVARSADSMGGILSAAEVTIADIGPEADSGSKDLEAVYSAAGQETGKYIEITVVMQPSSADPPQSPVLRSIQAFYTCNDLG